MADKHTRHPVPSGGGLPSDAVERNAHAPVRKRRRFHGRTVRTAIVCLVVVALLAAPAAFANTAVGYIAPIAALAMLAMGLAYLMVLKRSLSFTEHGPSSGSVRGDVLRFALSVRNGSLLPAMRIESVFNVSEAGGGARTDMRRVSLPPRSEKVFDLGVRFDHIGFFQVGISQVVVYDPLRVFCTRRDNETLHQVSIMPRTVDIASLDLSENSQLESSKNIKTFINDGMDYSGIRDYRWGDPMKSIHWKLSSKSESDYFTRLYETPSTPAIALIIDFECESGESDEAMGLYDALVESALSVERYATANGYETRLLFVDARGEAHDVAGPLEGTHEELMRRFPLLADGDGKQAIELFRKVSSSPNCPANLVMCTASVDEELLNALVSVNGPSRTPYLIAVCSDEDDRKAVKQQLRRLDDARIPFAVVREAPDLIRGDA